MNEAREMVEPGRTHLEVAEWTEDFIREQDAGLAFPVNISVDPEASHATPSRDDDTEFGEEMVCLDVGVHVDGYIADAAVTVDHTGTPSWSRPPRWRSRPRSTRPGRVSRSASSGRRSRT